MTESSEKPNVLILMIDCLRSDRTLANDRTCKTPNIDKLVKSGTSLPNVFVENSITAPSFTSIFTGRYAGNHGVIGMVGVRLSDEVTTMAEIFAVNGYRTYAEVTGPLSPLLNIDKGFSHYNFRSQHDYYFTEWGEQLLERFKNKCFDSPYLALIHFWEVHVPRQVPPEFNKPEFGATEYDRSLSALDNYIGRLLDYINDNTLVILTGDHGEAVGEVPPENTLLHYFLQKLELPPIRTQSDESIEDVSDLMAKEPLLHQFSIEISRLVEGGSKKLSLWLRIKLMLYLLKIGLTRYRIQMKKGIIRGYFSDLKQKVNDLMLFLAVARGNAYAAQLQLVRNSLREHSLQHGYHIYDYLQRVPVVFHRKGLVEEGKRIETELRQIDLLPTLIDMLELDAPADGFDGASYLLHMKNGGGKNRTIYLEARGGAQAEKVFLIRGMRHDNLKIAFAPHEKKAPIEYYDLGNDPQEIKNLSAEQNEKVNALRDKADGIASTFTAGTGVKLSAKEIVENVKILKSLGYM